MLATMLDESRPPERNAPSGTSETIWRCVVRMKVSWTRSTHSAPETERSGRYSIWNQRWMSTSPSFQTIRCPGSSFFTLSSRVFSPGTHRKVR